MDQFYRAGRVQYSGIELLIALTYKKILLIKKKKKCARCKFYHEAEGQCSTNQEIY